MYIYCASKQIIIVHILCTFSSTPHTVQNPQQKDQNQKHQNNKHEIERIFLYIKENECKR